MEITEVSEPDYQSVVVNSPANSVEETPVDRAAEDGPEAETEQKEVLLTSEPEAEPIENREAELEAASLQVEIGKAGERSGSTQESSGQPVQNASEETEQSAPAPQPDPVEEPQKPTKPQQPTKPEEPKVPAVSPEKPEPVQEEQPPVRQPEPHSHSWNSGAVTVQPGCAQAGVMTYTCTACGETRTESIPATGNHSWENDTEQNWVIDEDAYDEEVLTGTITYFECNRCGARYNSASEGDAYEQHVKDTGHGGSHTAREGVWETIHHDAVGHYETVVVGQHCSVCGKIK